MPKEMLPIVDKPTIQYIVEEAIASGIEDIIIVTGKGKRAIEDHFDTAFELEYHLRQKGKLELLEAVKRPSQVEIDHSAKGTPGTGPCGVVCTEIYRRRAFCRAPGG